MIDGFLQAQWEYVARYRSGRFQQAISSLTESTSRATTTLAVGFSSFVIITALGVAALLASPIVTVGLVAVPVVFYLCARPYLRRLRQRSAENVGDAMSLSESAAETAAFALEYRTTGTQQSQAHRLNGAVRTHADQVGRARTELFTMTFLFKDIALLSLIGIVAGLYLVTDLRSASITVAILLVVRMLGYLQQAFRFVQEGAEDLATDKPAAGHHRRPRVTSRTRRHEPHRSDRLIGLRSRELLVRTRPTRARSGVPHHCAEHHDRGGGAVRRREVHHRRTPARASLPHRRRIRRQR